VALQRTELEELIASRRAGFTLRRPFYTDQGIFDLDMRQVWLRYWLYAGHTSQLPESDSYFLFQAGDESVIVLRDENGENQAHANVCTHRGSRLLSEGCGRAKNLVCPYHQWVFRRDGSLRSAKLTAEGFDASLYGLKSVSCRVLEGFIFVCFASDPPDFGRLIGIYKPHLEMYQIEKTRVAWSKTYRVGANWKLIAENFRECYHCGVGHPEYCRAIIGANLLQARERYERLRSEKLKEWEAKGIPSYRIWFDPGVWAYCERYPYEPGFVTQSLDGQPLAPLLGYREDRDVGVFSIVQYPNFWLDVNNDHAMTIRFTPVSATVTEAETAWLVREDAVEGMDYDVDKLVAFWKTTAEQDWRLCEDNQLGVNSRHFAPGPYTPAEDGPDQFDSWYIDQIRKSSTWG